VRHVENRPEGVPQGAPIQKVADLKSMNKDVAVQFLDRMVLEGQIHSKNTDKSVRYFAA
jgi:hypothetical protein